jgi:hypothetical protein
LSFILFLFLFIFVLFIPVFFIAPGVCSLIKNKVVRIDYRKVVGKYFPNIVFVNVEDVSEATSKLSLALGVEVDKDGVVIQPQSDDWPFAD